MISAPLARTSAGFIALTVAAVPTGMKAGVRISPRRMAIAPVRALPSVAAMENVKRSAMAKRLERFQAGWKHPAARKSRQQERRSVPERQLPGLALLRLAELVMNLGRD